MPETVIKLENIGKQYRLGTVGSQTLRGDLQRLGLSGVEAWWYNMRGKDDPALYFDYAQYEKIGQSNQLNLKSNFKNHSSEYVWALKDINLEVIC